MSPDDPRHGQKRGYQVHQRDGEDACGPCREAASAYERSLYVDRVLGRGRRVIPARGTARRVQALAALGWTFGQMGVELGRHHDYARKLAANPDGFVNRATADLVDGMFRRLCMQVPPPGRNASYARTVAARNGWVPPLSWDDIDHDVEPPQVEKVSVVDLFDEVVVERVLGGDPKPRKLTNAEARELCRRALARGMTTPQIERTYGLKPERYFRIGVAA